MRLDLFTRTPAPIFLAGPTASGKSAAALELTRKLNGEIFSVDSMQVYRGMDIGTAKPAPDERGAIPHHLIDLVEVSDPFDVAQWLRAAEAGLAEVQASGRVPIFVGGTGLYFRALIDGLDPLPSGNPELREQISNTPMDELLAELAVKDPSTYARIDRANPRRVIRAVEILRQSCGQSPRGIQQPQIASPTPNFFILRRSRDDLIDRIDKRVEQMFAAGLLEETKTLITRGLKENTSAAQALGYKQVIEHLAGQRMFSQTIELVKLRTRQYAKRQITWFRHQHQGKWIDVGPADSPGGIASTIAANYTPSGTNSEHPRRET